jgi:parallel beta-helix repeat protein
MEMKIKDNFFTKFLALAIILLFFGSLIPVIDAHSIGISKITSEYTPDTKIEENNIFLDYSNKEEYVSEQIIVKFNDNLDISPTDFDNRVNIGISSVDKLNNLHQVKSIKPASTFQNSYLGNVYVLTLPQNSDINPIIEEYKKDNNVVYAEPNYLYYAYNTPNDPKFSSQWALDQEFDNDIDAPEAWDIETGDEDIVIAVIDTGVDYYHPDLRDNIYINEDEIPGNRRDDDFNGYIDDVYGWDFYNKDNDPFDDQGHGTHCAGTASAVTNNEIGVAGVSWNCKIMPVKFLSSTGNGTTTDGINAITYAANNGADVISMSWGGGFPSFLMESALRIAHSKGVVLVAAAGNDNSKAKHYPSGYEDVISVAATDINNYRAYFSNYGSWVDVAAPGVNIISTVPNNKYESYSGTSMACPHVAGLAGLILSKDNSLSPDRVRSIIEYSIDRLDPYDFPLRRGKINAYKALQRGTGNVDSIIESPYHGQEVEGTIDIIGTASGEGFEYYTIEYTKNAETEESEWLELTNSANSIKNQKMFSIDTTELAEGLYTIRLRVISDNSVYEDTIWILINNEINTINVDDDGGPDIDHTTIHQAIYDAGNGDTIYVYNGLYCEDLKIFRSINLTGEDKEFTIINGTEQNNVIFVSATDVKISDFTIQNGGINKGVYLYESENVDLNDNIIQDNWIGIKLSYSRLNTIQNNIVLNNTCMGILLTRRSHKNQILKNDFMCTFPIFYINAYFRNSFFNRWNGNYWDDWIGLKINRLSWKPKRISGKLFDFWPDTNPALFEEIYHSRLTLLANYDRNPASEPNFA